MIELRNITIHAGQFLLENVCLKAEANKFHVLLGPSGSGKTLLLETIAGLIAPSSGQIYLSEKLINKIPSENRNISYLPQDNALFPNKNVFKNIAFGLKLKKQLAKATIEEKVHDMASKLNVSHLLSRSVVHLSGGEQQRVALAVERVAESAEFKRCGVQPLGGIVALLQGVDVIDHVAANGVKLVCSGGDHEWIVEAVFKVIRWVIIQC